MTKLYVVSILLVSLEVGAYLCGKHLEKLASSSGYSARSLERMSWQYVGDDGEFTGERTLLNIANLLVDERDSNKLFELWSLYYEYRQAKSECALAKLDMSLLSTASHELVPRKYVARWKKLNKDCLGPDNAQKLIAKRAKAIGKYVEKKQKFDKYSQYNFGQYDWRETTYRTYFFAALKKINEDIHDINTDFGGLTVAEYLTLLYQNLSASIKNFSDGRNGPSKLMGFTLRPVQVEEFIDLVVTHLVQKSDYGDTFMDLLMSDWRVSDPASLEDFLKKYKALSGGRGSFTFIETAALASVSSILTGFAIHVFMTHQNDELLSENSKLRSQLDRYKKRDKKEEAKSSGDTKK